MNNTKQISELFDYQPKSGRKAGDGLGEGLFPFYTSGQTQSKYLNVHDFEGDSLVLGTGGKPSVHFATGKFSATNDCFVIKPKNEDEIHPKYLYYYFLNKMYLLENGFRGAGLKHLSRSYFNDLLIPIFDYHTSQLRIIDILDKTDALGQKRKESIKLLDDFLRSTFLEMFGDPLLNKNNFMVKELKDVVQDDKIVTYGIVQAGPDIENGVPYIKTSNIVNNQISLDGLSRTSEEIANKYERSKVSYGDLIISIRATVGTIAELPKELDGANLTQGTARISPGGEVNKYFLLNLIRSNGMQTWLKRQVKGATFKEITLTRLREMPIILPPIDLQIKFADIVHQVEKVKAKYKESEKELDNLFGSLMQRAFKGEL